MIIHHLHVSLDIVLFTLQNESLSVFLQKRSSDPFLNKWSLPSCETLQPENMTIDEAILGKLSELPFDELYYLEQVKSIGNATRDPRGWSLAVVYYGFIISDKTKAENINKHMAWFSIEDINANNLAFDHAQIIQDSYQRLQNKALYTSLPAFLLPQDFTLTELQKAYECVLGFTIEKKSFRRRMLDAGLLIETEKVRHANHRPAKVYQLLHKEPHIFSRIIEGMRS